MLCRANSHSVETKSIGNQNTNCYYTNARSLYNKVEEVEALVEQYQLKIIGITETWGRSEIFDAE